MESKCFVWALMITLGALYGDSQFIDSGQTIIVGGCRMEHIAECTAVIKCNRRISNFDNLMKNWECYSRRLYYRNSYYGRSMDNNYKLMTYFEDMYSLTLWNDIQSYTDHVITFRLDGGDLKSIPSVINQMTHIKEFKLTNNEIEVLVLKNFMAKQEMLNLNMSHNAITSIDVDEVDASRQQVETLSTLDLSYNLLDLLPKKCFSSFGNLKQIDLSHNIIKALDMFTFEGLTQLNTLNLSYNKLTIIGHAFVRFIAMKYLSIDHNQISTILESNLISMVNLEKINASYNDIVNIETTAFRSLSRLRSLDISHNRIEMVEESLFENTTNLETLHIADNEIEFIEPGAFKATNITDFTIDQNCISGTILKNTFSGVKVANLTLNGGKIETLGDTAFSTMNDSLVSLNLSTNSIRNISASAFKSLTLLSVLDLSYNNISELNFDASDCKNLLIFYAGYNKIAKIYKSLFDHLSSLEELDLSHNIINEIESNTFDSLSKLKRLLLNDNDLTNAVDAYVFSKLTAIDRIDFTNTKITTYNNHTFTNMTSLTTFISANGQLRNIAFNAFLGTGSIATLDLSYNLLDKFCINSTTIKEVITLRLNNNNLRNITNSTFYGLKSLRNLNLSSNDIFNVEPNSFQNLSNLVSLDLSSNPDMDLASKAFDNLKWLEDVSLSNIRKKFSFLNAVNTSMETLSLSNHYIDNINDIFVFHVKNLGKLDFSLNKITYVDKFSFQAMESLTWLDLSYNMITDIQPGSFSHMHMINELNLHDNRIQTIQYGVLDGCKNLRKLNLSDNALHSFDANILHTTPLLEIISLDNNAINSLSFRAFSKTQIRLIYLGGNPILCSVLVDLKRLENLDFNITAETLDYSSENVHGITCKTSVKDVLNEVYNNSGGNMTTMFRELAKTVVDLQETLKSVANHTAVKEDVLKAALTDVAKSVDVLATSYNKLQNTNENNFNMFLKALNESDHKNDNHSAVNLNLGNGSGIFRDYLNSNYLNLHEGNEDGDKYKDVKFLLYVIAVCLVFALIFILGVTMYIFVLKKYSMRLIPSHSIQPIIGNSIEMD